MSRSGARADELQMMQQIDTGQSMTDLALLKDRLKQGRFYGTILESWENGEIVRVNVEQSVKPKDFSRVFVEMRI